MALNDCNKKPEVQEGEEPTQDTRRPPNIRNWAAKKVDAYHAFHLKNERLERPNMDHDHQKKPKLSRFYPRDRPSCAMNPTSDMTKYPVPPFPADKSQINDPTSFPSQREDPKSFLSPEFTGVSPLARKGNDMALCLMDELSLYSSNPKAQNLARLQACKACCIKYLQDTGKKILRLLKQQRILSAELRRLSVHLTETVVIRDFCKELPPLEDLTRMRMEALVLIKGIKVLLRQIREISVTREFVKRSLVAVGSHVSSDEQQSINSQLAELKKLSKSFGKWLF